MLKNCSVSHAIHTVGNFECFQTEKSLSLLKKLNIEIDQGLRTDEFIENRVCDVYEKLKKNNTISEKYSSTWFDPLEKEFYDDIKFQSRSTPLTLTGNSTKMPDEKTPHFDPFSYFKVI